MTVSPLGRTLALIALCAYAHPPQRAAVRVADARIAEGQGAHRDTPGADTHVITASAMGHVRLGMTLDEARRAHPGASFRRTSDGDGAALVEIAFGQESSLSVWADEDDPATPIDWSKRIVSIETFSAAFHTPEGIHPGSLVTEVARFFGPVREIVKSEIESREYVTFARQPQTLTFRLDQTGIFSPGRRRTTSFAPGATIRSITISSP
jgi:hypothetical protein